MSKKDADAAIAALPPGSQAKIEAPAAPAPPLCRRPPGPYGAHAAARVSPASQPPPLLLTPLGSRGQCIDLLEFLQNLVVRLEIQDPTVEQLIDAPPPRPKRLHAPDQPRLRRSRWLPRPVPRLRAPTPPPRGGWRRPRPRRTQKLSSPRLAVPSAGAGDRAALRVAQLQIRPEEHRAEARGQDLPAQPQRRPLSVVLATASVDPQRNSCKQRLLFAIRIVRCFSSLGRLNERTCALISSAVSG